MAVEKTEQTAKLVYKVQTSIDGEPKKYSSQSIASMNPAASDEDVLEIGTAIASLQIYPVYEVSRQETSVLTATE